MGCHGPHGRLRGKAGVGDEVGWPLEDVWWDQDIRQGRLNRPRADVFLNYWLVMRALQEVRAADIFSTFRRRYKQRSHGAIEEIAADVKIVAAAYRRLEVIQSQYALPQQGLAGTLLRRRPVGRGGDPR